MTTTNEHQWTIGPMGRGATEHRSGAAAAHTEAWTQALSTLGQRCSPASSTPSPSPSMSAARCSTPPTTSTALSTPAQLTATLVELHRAATGDNVADLPSEG